jgi:hypothetical protein
MQHFMQYFGSAVIDTEVSHYRNHLQIPSELLFGKQVFCLDGLPMSFSGMAVIMKENQ